MDQMTNQNQPEMNADEAKASLGIATFLQDKLMPKAPMGEQQQEQKQPEEQQQDPFAEIQSLKEEVMGELVKMKEDIKLASKGDAKDERTQESDLKREIEEVLNRTE